METKKLFKWSPRQIAIILLIFLVISAISVFAILTQKRIQNGARIKTVGIEVYWEPECINSVERIDWGYLESGETVSKILYLKSISNIPITLHMSTEEWNPPVASEYISVAWDAENTRISPNEVLPITISLSVSPTISNITEFSFTIVIIGEG